MTRRAATRQGREAREGAVTPSSREVTRESDKRPPRTASREVDVVTWDKDKDKEKDKEKEKEKEKEKD